LAIRFGVILRKVWGWQPDLGRRTSPVRADVGVADVLAAGALGPGLPESTPPGHAGGPGHILVTHRTHSLALTRRWFHQRSADATG